MMNKKHIIILGSLLLLNSCIVKSLQPFYTKDTLVKNDNITGSWTDQKGGHWKIVNFTEEFHKDYEPGEKISEDDKETLEKFKDSYFLNYTDNKNRDADFFIFIFKINQNYYADFTPFFTNSNDLNDLEEDHLISTHSVAKINFSNENTIKFSWFREEKLSKLIEDKKIRIKYFRNKITEDLLFIDTSENLQEFLKRYEASNIEDKWSEKDSFILSRTIHAKK